MTNKSNKKRVAVSLAATALVSTLAIGGATLAYLTDSETVTNTFTVGDVKIELLEPNYPGNDNPEEVEDLVPNEEVDKDPKIVNRGVNDTVMFMVLDSPMEAITLVDDEGSPIYTQKKTETQSYTDEADGSTKTREVTYDVPQRKVDEIFWYKDAEDETSTHANNFDSNWTQLPAKSMYIIKDRFGNETQVVFTDDSATDVTNDRNSDLDDTNLNQNLFTGSQRLFPTDGLDATNKLTKRQAALQALYASLPADSTLVHRYVFAYNTDTQGSTLNDDDKMKESAKLGNAASARETTTLFEKVQLKNFIEDELDKTTQSIEIRAYAIQDSELLEESADLGARLNAGTLNATDLNHIYDMFVNQNSEVVNGENLRIINMREADSVQVTTDGEIDRKNDGSFKTEAEMKADGEHGHTNRWDTTDEVGASDDKTAGQKNINPAGSSSGSGQGQQQTPTGVTAKINGNAVSVPAGQTWGEYAENNYNYYEDRNYYIYFGDSSDARMIAFSQKGMADANTVIDDQTEWYTMAPYDTFTYTVNGNPYHGYAGSRAMEQLDMDMHQDYDILHDGEDHKLVLVDNITADTFYVKDADGSYVTIEDYVVPNEAYTLELQY